MSNDEERLENEFTKAEVEDQAELHETKEEREAGLQRRAQETKLNNFDTFGITVILTICIPLVISGIFSLFPQFDNIYYEACAVFLISIVLFHIFMASVSNNISSSFLKSLDYIYLTSAAIGLLTATESARSDVSNRYNTSLQSILAEIGEIKNDIVETTSLYCDQIKMESRCSTERKYGQEISAYLSNEKFDRVSDYSKLVIMLRSKLNNGQSSVLNIINKIRADTIEFYIRTSPDPSRLYFPDVPKSIGAMFLACALALRLTRVTAEVRKWHVP